MQPSRAWLESRLSLWQREVREVAEKPQFAIRLVASAHPSRAPVRKSAKGENAVCLRVNDGLVLIAPHRALLFLAELADVLVELSGRESR